MSPAQASRKTTTFVPCEDALLTPRNDADNGVLNEADIRAALERLLEDKRLHMSERNRRFLRFVTEEKLAGRTERIKSYTVAVDVFGRAPTFDGLTDPIVRIEATRLRAALDAFYHGPGADEDIIIELPKGAYVPRFRRSERRSPDVPPFRAKSTAPAIRTLSNRRAVALTGLVGGYVLCAAILLAVWSPWKPPDNEMPIVAIEPVQSLSGATGESRFAQGLTQSIVSSLSRVPDTRLVHLREGRASADPAGDDGKALVYRIESTLRMNEGGLRFWWSMVDARSGRTLWSETIDRPQGEMNSMIEDEIATRVAVRIAEYHGVFGTR